MHSGKQQEILQQLGPSNPIVSVSQYVNTLKKIAESAGFKDTDQFFRSGAEVDQALAAQAEQQSQGNSAMEIEQQKLQMQMQLDQQKLQMQMELQREKATAELALEREKFAAEIALRRDELQAELSLREQKIALGGSVSTNLPRA